MRSQLCRLYSRSHPALWNLPLLTQEKVSRLPSLPQARNEGLIFPQKAHVAERKKWGQGLPSSLPAEPADDLQSVDAACIINGNEHIRLQEG